MTVRPMAACCPCSAIWYTELRAFFGRYQADNLYRHLQTTVTSASLGTDPVGVQDLDYPL